MQTTDVATRIDHGSIGVKRKQTSILLPMIESTYKNNKVLMDAMDQINST
jgi:tRNA A37 threonylcarbamoyladenosine modification protein TsaB